MGYIYISGTVLLTVYGQLMMKWRISLVGQMPATTPGKLHYFGHLLLDYWVISCFIAAFFAALSWMAALSEFDVTYAYPFTSVGFVLVLLLGVLIFGESMTASKLLGVTMIIAGIIVGSR